MTKIMISACENVELTKKAIINRLIENKKFFIVKDNTIIISKTNLHIHLIEKPKFISLENICDLLGDSNFIELEEPENLLKQIKKDIINISLDTTLLNLGASREKYDKNQMKFDNYKNMQKIKKYKR